MRNALRVLEVFSEDSHVLGVSEIARRLNLAKSTTSRLVATLCSEDFLTATPTGTYRLGVRLFDRGLIAVHSYDLYRAAIGALAEVRAATGFSAHFAVVENAKIVQIHRLSSNDIEKFGESRVYHPFHATGTGKAILAFSEPAFVEQIVSARLRRFTNATITDADTLRAAIDQARSNEYASARDEYMAGISDVAVPILNRSGLAVAALTVVALTHQMTELAVIRSKTTLLACARAVSRASFD